jgi:hypothetical protein
MGRWPAALPLRGEACVYSAGEERPGRASRPLEADRPPGRALVGRGRTREVAANPALPASGRARGYEEPGPVEKAAFLRPTAPGSAVFRGHLSSWTYPRPYSRRWVLKTKRTTFGGTSRKEHVFNAAGPQ